MSWEQLRRAERVMALEDLPAPFRKYLLQAAQYTLKQMPQDSVAQREIMLEQDTETHWPNGNERRYRTARFTDEFHPGLASCPETIRCIVQTTHDVATPAEQYRTGGNTHLSLEVEYGGKRVGGEDTIDKDTFMFTRRMEKFWRTVAASVEPPLVEKEHNVVHPGFFGFAGYSQGDNTAIGLQFNSADHKKVVAALEKMLVEVNAELAAEAAADPIERLFAAGSPDSKGSSGRLR